MNSLLPQEDPRLKQAESRPRRCQAAYTQDQSTGVNGPRAVFQFFPFLTCASECVLPKSKCAEPGTGYGGSETEALFLPREQLHNLKWSWGDEQMCTGERAY